MSNLYRKSATDLTNEKTHALTSEMQGAKLSNSFDMDNHMFTVGLDYSKRNWDGQFYANGVAALVSLNDVDTKNAGIHKDSQIIVGKFVDVDDRPSLTDNLLKIQRVAQAKK